MNPAVSKSIRTQLKLRIESEIEAQPKNLRIRESTSQTAIRRRRKWVKNKLKYYKKQQKLYKRMLTKKQKTISTLEKNALRRSATKKVLASKKLKMSEREAKRSNSFYSHKISSKRKQLRKILRTKWDIGTPDPHTTAVMVKTHIFKKAEPKNENLRKNSRREEGEVDVLEETLMELEGRKKVSEEPSLNALERSYGSLFRRLQKKRYNSIGSSEGRRGTRNSSSKKIGIFRRNQSSGRLTNFGENHRGAKTEFSTPYNMLGYRATKKTKIELIFAKLKQMRESEAKLSQTSIKKASTYLAEDQFQALDLAGVSEIGYPVLDNFNKKNKNRNLGLRKSAGFEYNSYKKGGFAFTGKGRLSQPVGMVYSTKNLRKGSRKPRSFHIKDYGGASFEVRNSSVSKNL